MFCYYTNRLASPNKWTKLPHYIAYILGYSKTTGRTYFRGLGSSALLSTYNGVRLELTPEYERPQDIRLASALPGFSRGDVSVTISGTTFTG